MADTRQPNLIALCAVLLVASTLVVSARCWASLSLKHRTFGWDDVFAMATMPFIIAETGLILWWVKLGLGKHAAALPPENVAKSPLIIFAAAFLYDCAICFPKFSALFFYRRVFAQTTHTWFHWALWTVFALNSGWLVSALVSTVFQCIPVRAIWNPSIPGKCFPQWNWFLGTALGSMIIDVLILLMPMPLIWNLKASLSRRLQVITIFVAGYSVVVVSIGRLISIARTGSGYQRDITWDLVTYVMWVQCEGPISVISVSLPLLFGLVKTVRRHGWRALGQPEQAKKNTIFQTGEISRYDEKNSTANLNASTGKNSQYPSYQAHAFFSNSPVSSPGDVESQERDERGAPPVATRVLVKREISVQREPY